MSNCRCGSTWDGYKITHCPVCHETFTTITADDSHRIGGWDPGDEPRRCQTPEEMTSRARRPLARNAKGRWTFLANLQSADSWVTRVQETAVQPDPVSLDGYGVSGTLEAL